jgi:hypothetical protein
VFPNRLSKRLILNYIDSIDHRHSHEKIPAVLTQDFEMTSVIQRHQLVVLAAMLTIVGCNRPSSLSTPSIEKQASPKWTAVEGRGAGIELRSLNNRSVGGSTLFERIESVQTGIDFVLTWKILEGYDIETGNDGGVCLGDYDGDGLADVFLTRPEGGNRLYRNLGGFRFQDVTQKAGIDEGGWGAGATFVDIDGDGNLDLYVCGFDRPNRLYVNRGDGTFSERASQYGLNFSGSSVMFSFADYDLDGDLDGYLLTNRYGKVRSLDSVNFQIRDGRLIPPTELEEVVAGLVKPDGSYVTFTAGQRDHLYRNDGDGTFTDVSEQAGIAGAHLGLSATWWDYNGDAYPDLYVANDFWGPDHLYRNNGDGTFSDVNTEVLPHTPWFSMGADVADINNDGRLDFMASDMSGSNHYNQKVSMGDMNKDGWFLEYPEPRQYMRNAVYLNSGTDRFCEVAYLTGLADTDWTWSIKFADLDSDGYQDVFITNGMTRDWTNSDIRLQVSALGGKRSPAGQRLWMSQPKKKDANKAYRNLGDLQFEDIGQSWGLDHVGVSYGAALDDLDNDGDLDLVVTNLDEQPGIYRNNGTSGHQVKVRLRGTRSNSYGIGTTVRLHNAGGT